MDWQQFCAALPTVDTVTVEAYSGTAGIGDLYEAPVAVTPCVVQEVQHTVPVTTGDAAGKLYPSSALVMCPLATVAPAGSRITLPSGRKAKVLASATITANGLALPEHVELDLE